MNIRHAVAEFLGVFALTFVGAGAIIATQGAPHALIAVALAHGLILSVMVCAAIHTSGGQFNPAVTVGLALIGLQSWPRAIVFIVAQLAGGVIAALAVKALIVGAAPVPANLGATIGSLTMDGQTLRVFGLELIATFLLMFVILGSAADSRNFIRPVAGFAIGLTVAAVILCIGPLTGASMNPARSFGPALVAGAWTMHGVYWLAPIVGASLAAIVYRSVFGFGKP